MSPKRKISSEEAAEQAPLIRSQIHLFWGNMLYKLSPVECKLGMMDWNKNLGPALERLKLDGTSKAKISILLKYQCLNLDAVEGNGKKYIETKGTN